MNFSAVILAGGKSSRMGCDKAFLEIGGQALLARQIAIARAAGATESFISGRAGTDYSAFGCRVLKDNFPNAGPLAGIEAALAAAKNPLLLVLAVDLPEMNSDFLRALAAHGGENSGVVARVNGNLEPLAAFYPKSSQSLAETLLCAGRNAVINFAEQCVQANLVRLVELPAYETKYFTNWNSPTDFASAAVDVSTPPRAPYLPFGGGASSTTHYPPRHNGRFDGLFYDGHVQPIKPADLILGNFREPNSLPAVASYPGQ